MSFTGGMQMIAVPMNILDTKIGFTKHALDRFKERIMPLLCENTRNTNRRYSDFKKLISKARFFADDINHSNNDVIKINAFLTIEGNPTIPLTFVIETKKKKILTIYTQSGWKITTEKKGITWRWLS
tara:strand:- start:127 stop:507 length:381 start_codon:yes stop_codon:yes gene_type:complete